MARSSERPVGSGEDNSGRVDVSVADNEHGDLNGTYSVDVEAVRCPGTVEGIPIDRDNGNDWNLRVTADVGTIQQGGGG